MTRADYINLVAEHLIAVQQAWDFVRESPGYRRAGDETFNALMRALIDTHDSSRFSSMEMSTFVEIQPGEMPVTSVEHYKRNPHHVSFWERDGVYLEAGDEVMLLYAYECVCDHIAFSPGREMDEILLVFNDRYAGARAAGSRFANLVSELMEELR